MRRRQFLLSCAAFTAAHATKASAQDSSLFAQGAAAVLHRNFADAGLSWLLVSRSGDVLAERWQHAEQVVAPGSLLKPFLAAAYGEQHGASFPRLQCAGKESRCWYPKGHGEIGIEQALAQSCNAYFLGLAAMLDEDVAPATLRGLGLHAPAAMRPEDLIGLTSVWRETPLTIARAYLAVFGSGANATLRHIAGGMEAAARSGTAKGASVAMGAGSVLGKTGTAVCSHSPRGMADGFAVLLYPAADPRLLLLVRRHGTTGAQTSSQAGEMLRAIGLGT